MLDDFPTQRRHDRTQAPLFDTLKQCAERTHTAFYAPGHKRGQGTPPKSIEWLGQAMFQADLPELPELDDLAAPSGAIQEAQELAAEAFAADRSWFVINGSTAGIIASILATCNPGDKIILPRNVHKSAISGLILSGAIPVFVRPAYDRLWDLALGLSPSAVEAALESHPDTKAVMLVSPTYHGVCSDIAQISQIAHYRGIPVLVDEAHGPHFGFHGDLPASALQSGADLAVQSTHKVLAAMTQASMMHLKGSRINGDRLHRALQMVQTTSPSYLLLASLDAARRQIATQGEALMARTLELARDARTRIAGIPGLSVWEMPTPEIEGCFALDATRVTVKVTELGISGYEADEILHEQLGVTAELALPNHLTFMISLGNTAVDIDRLIAALTTLSHRFPLSQTEVSNPFPIPHSPFPIPLFSPREAFFAPVETIAIAASIGRASAELICPYPPGIPVLMPGEEITQEAIDLLQNILRLGGHLSGCTDTELQTLQVVREF
jgi:arginine decarboxylase